MSAEKINLVFGFIACSISVGLIVWRAIILRLNTEILSLQHKLEIKDIQIENLQDVQTLLSKGLEEKFEHFAGRIKLENLESKRSLGQVVHFLTKTTEFEIRE